MTSRVIFLFIILWESQWFGQHSTIGGAHKRKENLIKPRDGTEKHAKNRRWGLSVLVVSQLGLNRGTEDQSRSGGEGGGATAS